MKLPVMLLVLVVLATGTAFNLGRDSRDIGSAWDILPLTEDKLCRSCSWRSHEHVTCSHIFAVNNCRDLIGMGGNVPSFPTAPEDIQVTFDGGMNIQWNAGIPNLDKLEGFYMKVLDLYHQKSQCRLFDLRNLNITVEDIERTNFQYSCFPPEFVQANTQYIVIIQSIPVHYKAEKIFKTPPVSLTDSSTEPPAQSVLAWKPHRVDVTPSKGELEVSFAAAPKQLGVLRYQIQLMDADNSMTREITAAPVQTNGMVSVVFPVLCKDDGPLPSRIVIQAAAEDGKGGCLCAPDEDFVVVTAPCRHPCPRRYYPVSITHSELCSPNPPAQSVRTWNPHPVHITQSKGELRVSFASAPEQLGVLDYYIQLVNPDNITMIWETAAPTDDKMVSVVFDVLCKDGATFPAGIWIQAAAEDGKGGCLCAPDGDFIVVSTPCRHPCPRRYYPVSITHSEVCNNAGPAGNQVNQKVSKETIAAAVASATILCTVLIFIGVLFHKKKKPCYKVISLVWSGAYEQEKIMNLLEKYFDNLGLIVSQFKLSNFHDDAKPIPGVLYIMVPPSDGTAQHSECNRFVKNFSPIAIHLEGSLRLQAGPLKMFNLPDQRPALLEHIQGWPRCGKKLRSSDTMDKLEQEIMHSYKRPNPIPDNKDSGYVPADFDSVPQVNTYA